MEHPQALHDEKKSGPVSRFARNQLCALVKPGLAVDSVTLLDRMLDPNIKLATSTPKSDPSGDYAFEVFHKAQEIKPGAQSALEKKALQLTGGANNASPPPGRTVYGWHVAEGRADIFLTYCTNALAAQKEDSRQQVVALPEKLAVGANYGLTVINGGPPAAQGFADFILSSEGQKILTSHGFSPCRQPAIWRFQMKLSARNQLKGKIVEVKKGATSAHVRIDIGAQTLTASITNDSVDELKLEKGKTAYAIIKATSVMVGVD
jgi:molybdopterin-binding protein